MDFQQFICSFVSVFSSEKLIYQVVYIPVDLQCCIEGMLLNVDSLILEAIKFQMLA